MTDPNALNLPSSVDPAAEPREARVPDRLALTIDHDVPDVFKAVTWNVYHGTDPKVLAPHLDRHIKRGVGIFLVQEMQRPDTRALFRDRGLGLAFQPRQYGIAYDREKWTLVDHGGVRLSNVAYYAKGSDRAQYADAAWAVLVDPAGRSLLTLSYHLPSNVQVADPAPNRFAATTEAMSTLRALAAASTTTACLFGGDDNVDEERTRWPERFRFMRSGGGLRQVVASDATFNKTRRIDDFRIAGPLQPVEGGDTVHRGGGDHRIYEQVFGWTGRAALTV